jgi:hypothetical protein
MPSSDHTHRRHTLDTPAERLPAGMVPAGYDADRQVYKYLDKDGSIYESEPGNQYWGLTRVSGPGFKRQLSKREQAMWAGGLPSQLKEERKQPGDGNGKNGKTDGGKEHTKEKSNMERTTSGNIKRRATFGGIASPENSKEQSEKTKRSSARASTTESNPDRNSQLRRKFSWDLKHMPVDELDDLKPPKYEKSSNPPVYEAPSRRFTDFSQLEEVSRQNTERNLARKDNDSLLRRMRSRRATVGDSSPRNAGTNGNAAPGIVDAVGRLGRAVSVRISSRRRAADGEKKTGP